MEFEKHRIFENILHLACKSNNVDIVKYLISLNIIDIKDKNITNKFF